MRYPGNEYMRRILSVAALCIISCGCGLNSSIEKVVVHGQVHFDDQPVANGEILFYPIEGTGGSASGGPIKDSQYTVKGQGGVPVGKHRVEIRGYHDPQDAGPDDHAVGRGPAEQYLPARYNENSELTVSIKADGSNAIQNFTLSSKKPIKLE